MSCPDCGHQKGPIWLHPTSGLWDISCSTDPAHTTPFPGNGTDPGQPGGTCHHCHPTEEGETRSWKTAGRWGHTAQCRQARIQSWKSGGWQRGGLPLCPSGPGGSGEAKSPLSVAAAPLSPPGRAQPTPVVCERQGPTEGSGAEGGVSTKGPVLCSDVSSSPLWGGLELIHNHPSPALTPQPVQRSTSYEGSLQFSCWALEQP